NYSDMLNGNIECRITAPGRPPIEWSSSLSWDGSRPLSQDEIADAMAYRMMTDSAERAALPADPQFRIPLEVRECIGVDGEQNDIMRLEIESSLLETNRFRIVVSEHTRSEMLTENALSAALSQIVQRW